MTSDEAVETLKDEERRIEAVLTSADIFLLDPEGEVRCRRVLPALRVLLAEVQALREALEQIETVARNGQDRDVSRLQVLGRLCAVEIKARDALAGGEK